MLQVVNVQTYQEGTFQFKINKKKNHINAKKREKYSN